MSHNKSRQVDCWKQCLAIVTHLQLWARPWKIHKYADLELRIPFGPGDSLVFGQLEVGCSFSKQSQSVPAGFGFGEKRSMFILSFL